MHEVYKTFSYHFHLCFRLVHLTEVMACCVISRVKRQLHAALSRILLCAAKAVQNHRF